MSDQFDKGRGLDRKRDEGASQCVLAEALNYFCLVYPTDVVSGGPIDGADSKSSWKRIGVNARNGRSDQHLAQI
jgi:hypothetical protein